MLIVIMKTMMLIKNSPTAPALNVAVMIAASVAAAQTDDIRVSERVSE